MKTKTEKLAKQHPGEHNHNTGDNSLMYMRTVWIWNA